MAATQQVTLTERLARNSALNAETGCIEWTASKRNGYGRVHWDGKPRTVHRLAWAAAHGPIPAGFGVLHRCDNPACLNPDHLFIGTHKENMRDMKSKGRANRPRGATNPRAKLTLAHVDEIRACVESGYSLSKRLGVGQTIISRIRRGLAW